jgi:hypothetical protein
MRLFKSKEQRLRDRGGKTARATVLERRPALAGLALQEDDARLYVYRLRVEPDDEPAFEAETKSVAGDVYHEAGANTLVVYDPTNHGKIVFDAQALKAKLVDR